MFDADDVKSNVKFGLNSLERVLQKSALPVNEIAPSMFEVYSRCGDNDIRRFHIDGMVDCRSVFSAVILQEQLLQRRFDRGCEPSVVAYQQDAGGAVGIKAFAGPFVADGDPVVVIVDAKVRRTFGGEVVGGSVEKDRVDPSAGPGGEGVGFTEGNEDDFVGDAVVTPMKMVGGISILPVGGVECTEDDVDLMGTLFEGIEYPRFAVEKDRQNRFGQEDGLFTGDNGSVDLFQDNTVLAEEIGRVPFGFDGDTGPRKSDASLGVVREDENFSGGEGKP